MGRRRLSFREATIAAGGVAAVVILGLTATGADASKSLEVYYFHNGHLGQPLVVTNDSGGVVWSADYEPYGELYGETGSIAIGDPNTTGMDWKPQFRYPGQMDMPGTGMFQNQWRYYRPGLGGYSRPDPLESDTSGFFSGGIYTYASLNPINYYDDTGLYIVHPLMKNDSFGLEILDKAISKIRERIESDCECERWFEKYGDSLDALLSEGTMPVVWLHDFKNENNRYAMGGTVGVPSTLDDEIYSATVHINYKYVRRFDIKEKMICHVATILMHELIHYSRRDTLHDTEDRAFQRSCRRGGCIVPSRGR